MKTFAAPLAYDRVHVVPSFEQLMATPLFGD
jgi:hypothetical protein